MGPVAIQSVMSRSLVSTHPLHRNAQTSQTSRQGMHGTERCAFAFSSGTCMPSKNQHSRAKRQNLSTRRSSIVLVRAAAATDLASATQQAITKTVGGDIFVAGHEQSNTMTRR